MRDLVDRRRTKPKERRRDMTVLEAHVVSGYGHFRRRMTTYHAAFEKATGEKLVPGTLNIKVEEEIRINEHFRIRGTEICEPQQDLLFEICRINGIWAYRIRPCSITNGRGGHGDNILEIACSQEIRPATPGSPVKITLFGDHPFPHTPARSH